MNVNLSDDLADFVTAQTHAGGYTNQSEVVREGLRLLRARDREREALLAALDRGLEEARTGNVKPLTADALRDIARRGRRLAEQRAAEKH